MAISEWVSMDSYTVHTRKTVCLHGEVVNGFFGLGGVEFGQHDLRGRIVLELDDIFASGFAKGFMISISAGADMLLYKLCVGSHAQGKNEARIRSRWVWDTRRACDRSLSRVTMVA